MSDDLVKRLRNTPNWLREGFNDWKDNVKRYDRAPFEAADRIEELEAKVAKAIEVLRDIEGRSRPLNPIGNPKWVNYHTHAAISELER